MLLTVVNAVMPKQDKLWRKLSAAEYAALYPARPAALRKMAFGFRRLAAIGQGGITIATPARTGLGNQVFTMNEKDLAEACNVSVRTLQRYLWLFESYGILEVKRWRYRAFGSSPNSYRLYLGNVIPENYPPEGGDWPISPRDRHGEGKRKKPR
jgi:hypothetical protein